MSTTVSNRTMLMSHQKKTIQKSISPTEHRMLTEMRTPPQTSSQTEMFNSRRANKINPSMVVNKRRKIGNIYNIVSTFDQLMSSNVVDDAVAYRYLQQNLGNNRSSYAHLQQLSPLCPVLNDNEITRKIHVSAKFDPSTTKAIEQEYNESLRLYGDTSEEYKKRFFQENVCICSANNRL